MTLPPAALRPATTLSPAATTTAPRPSPASRPRSKVGSFSTPSRVDGSDAAPGTPGFQPAGAEVNTLVVTTLVDEDDAAATTENPGGAGLSLREAIRFANADAAADTITFATGPGTIFLGTLNQLTISTSMSIIGPGITLSGRNDAADAGPSNNRLVFVNGGADPIAVTLDGLTLRDGAAELGGAINATSVDALTVSNATLVGNFAGGGGGAIFSSASNTTVVNSTLSGNRADGGGAIFADFGTLTVTNSTVSGNTASNVSGGGGIFATNAHVSFHNAVVAGNDATTGPGDDLLNAGPFLFDSPGVNLFGNVDGVAFEPGSLGNDIVLAGAGRQNNGQAPGVDAPLTDVFASIDPATGGGALADNGGQVATIALNPTGLAVDRGVNADAGALAFDARGPGFARVADGRDGDATATVDLGAFETAADTPPTIPIDANGGTNTVQEGAARGTTVGVTAASTDAEGLTVHYSLTADTSIGGFAIDPDTGVVTVLDPTKLDFESTGPGHTHSITVQASDGTLTSSQSFSIAVSDAAPSLPTDGDGADEHRRPRRRDRHAGRHCRFVE